MVLITTIDYVTFYLITQKHFYKNDLCQIFFLNTFISSPHVLFVAKIFCHLSHTKFEKKKKKVVSGQMQYSQLGEGLLAMVAIIFAGR
jgi:hypothetical protein